MISCLPVQFLGEKLKLLDQRLLPAKEVFVECSSVEEAHKAIKDMVVRGAPCIGFTGIFGLALAAKSLSPFQFSQLQAKGDYLKTARPTAVNLAYEIENALKKTKNCQSSQEAYNVLVDHGLAQINLSEKNNRMMASYAIKDLDARVGKRSYNILTHCNTGFLACGSIGTALGVIQQLGEENRISNVWVDETRPYLQGTRLTAFELGKLNIPHQIVVEGAASYLMKNSLVDAIFVGADRIVSNGDTANKIGTSNLAIVAKEYDVPFYVAAPMSTFDFTMENGDQIEIELREESEVLGYGSGRVAPSTSRGLNPSFDVTDNKFITGIVSEKGVFHQPYRQTLKQMEFGNG